MYHPTRQMRIIPSAMTLELRAEDVPEMVVLGAYRPRERGGTPCAGRRAAGIGGRLGAGWDVGMGWSDGEICGFFLFVCGWRATKLAVDVSSQREREVCKGTKRGRAGRRSGPRERAREGGIAFDVLSRPAATLKVGVYPKRKEDPGEREGETGQKSV